MSPKPENEISSNSSQSESVSVDLTLENSAVDESLSVDSGKAQKRNHSNTSEDIDNKKLNLNESGNNESSSPESLNVSLSSGNASKAKNDLNLNFSFDSFSNQPEADFEPKTPHWVPLILTSLGALKEEVKAVNEKLDAFESFKTDILNQVESIRHDVEAVKKEVQDKIVHDICALQTETIAVKKQGEEHEKSLNFMNGMYDDMKKEFSALQSKNDNLQKVIDTLSNQIDSNEQHNRNECLLMHGIPEKTKELPNDSRNIFIQNINEHLGLNVVVEPNMIRRAHRLGKKRTDGKPRPIIARFWNSELRNEIYFNKKKLKHKPVSISENLTKRRMNQKKLAEQQFGSQHVWTKEGRVYAKDEKGMIKTICS